MSVRRRNCQLMFISSPVTRLRGPSALAPTRVFRRCFTIAGTSSRRLPGDEREAYGAAVDQVEAFWRGRWVRTLNVWTPDRHDVVLAVTSHLPHLIAFNIVAMAEDLEKRH